MSDGANLTCPRCGSALASGIVACPRCGEAALVDLALAEPIADERMRHFAARTASGWGAPYPGYGELKLALEHAGSVVVAGVAAADAPRLRDRLAAAGIAVAARPALPRRTADAPVAGESETESPRRRSGRRAALVTIVALAVIVGGMIARRNAPDRRPARSRMKPAGSLQRDAALALRSTATVRCRRSLGSGFFVEPDLLVTNAHVICADDEAPEVVLPDGRKLSGTVEAKDDWIDLALLRVAGADARPLPTGDPTRLAEGDTVIAVGSPVGLDATVTKGIVSHRERSMMGIDYVQFDANVNPGNSGGPLVDDAGRAVAVVAMMVGDARGIGLAIPIAYLARPPFSLPAIASAVDRDRWQAVLGRTKEAERRDVEEISTAFEKPVMAAALAAGPQRIAAIVARRASSEPEPEQFSFSVYQKKSFVCSLVGSVQSWSPLDSSAQKLPSSSRYLTWLERNGFSRDIFVGAVPLDATECSPDAAVGSELTLDGADPSAATAEISEVGER